MITADLPQFKVIQSVKEVGSFVNPRTVRIKSGGVEWVLSRRLCC